MENLGLIHSNLHLRSMLIEGWILQLPLQLLLQFLLEQDLVGLMQMVLMEAQNHYLNLVEFIQKVHHFGLICLNTLDCPNTLQHNRKWMKCIFHLDKEHPDYFYNCPPKSFPKKRYRNKCRHTFRSMINRLRNIMVYKFDCSCKCMTNSHNYNHNSNL